MKNIKIIPEIICKCKNPEKIAMVYPVPDICNYCRKFIIVQRERLSEENIRNTNICDSPN